MSLVIVPEAVGAKLTAPDGAVEVCTPDGTRLGYFTPGPVKKYNLDPGVSEEELDRDFASGPGRPLADILRDLGARK